MSSLLLHRTLKAASATPFIVVVGSNPAMYGWALPSIGTISPNNLLRGQAMQTLHSPPASEFGYDFTLVVPDVVIPQLYFKYLLVQTTSGALRHLAADAADFETGGGAYSQWFWGTGSNLVWGSVSVGQQRIVNVQW